MSDSRKSVDAEAIISYDAASDDDISSEKHIVMQEIEYIEDEIEYLDEASSEYSILFKQEPREITSKQIENGDEHDDQQKELIEDELYYCSACDVNFPTPSDHIKKYHNNQSVLIDNSVCDHSTRPINENEDTDFEDFIEIEESSVKEELTDFKQEPYDDSDMEGYKDQYTIETIMDVEDHLNDACIDEDPLQFEKRAANSTRLEKKSFQTAPVVNSKSFRRNVVYICPYCDQTFNDVKSYNSHRKQKHAVNIRSKSNYQKKEKVASTCLVCSTTFPSEKSLKLHLRMHGPVKQKSIEESLSMDLKACLKQTGECPEQFFCELCEKSYDKTFENDHKVFHEGGEQHLCTTCNRKFASAINLKMHIEAHQDHSAMKKTTKGERNGLKLQYPCSFCGREFARPHEKVKHERIHTGEKPYKCEICGKTFRVQYCLTLHLRTHTGARPYVCAHCNKRFKSYSVYNHHLNTHSEDRPYKCPYCPKAFKTSVQWAGHKNCHTKPFSCPECNRPFASLYAVKIHMETHQKGGQNLKHKCQLCGAIYARVFALRDHLRDHHDAKFDENAIESALIDTEEDVEVQQSVQLLEESIIPTEDDDAFPHSEEQIVGEIEQFQNEVVITDWLK